MNAAVPIHYSGPPGERLDLLILGDGYAAPELERFHRAAARVTEALLATEPFASNRRRLNVWRRDLVSDESGISARGVSRRTALSSRHDFLSPHAIGSFAPWRIQRACRGAPHDVVMVLVNSSRRGGWCVPFTRVGFAAFPTEAAVVESAPPAGGALASAPPFDATYPGDAFAYAADTFLHELGHACAGLGDEYDVELARHVGRGAWVFRAALALASTWERLTRRPIFPNITFRAAHPPWPRALGSSPPIEGALGLARGAFRASLQCKMRLERYDFCPVCQDAIVRRAFDRFSPPRQTQPALGDPGLRRRTYDATVTTYRLTFLPLWRLFGGGHRRWVFSRLEALGARAILDAGTGTGFWAGVIAAGIPGARVVGADFSPRYLEVARRDHGDKRNLTFCETDITQLPFAAGAYDAVVCSRVIDTMPDRTAALREFRRVLRPGGELLLFLKGSATWPDQLMRAGLKLLVRGSPSEVWHAQPLHRTLEAEAKAHQLEVVDLKQTSFMTRVALRAV